jgi:putative oxidoreductase
MNTTPNMHQPAHSSLPAWPYVAWMKLLPAGYVKYVQKASHLQSFVLLFLRLTIAWQLAESGYGHLMNIEGTAQHFREWGVPLPVLSVHISGATELIGGILLILGLGARLIAVPLLFNFNVAYATASRGNLIQLFTGPMRLDAYDAVINDTAFTMIVLSLTMLAFGAGKASVDHCLKRVIQKRVAGNK